MVALVRLIQLTRTTSQIKINLVGGFHPAGLSIESQGLKHPLQALFVLAAQRFRRVGV
jgi:hypothetical protein